MNGFNMKALLSFALILTTLNLSTARAVSCDAAINGRKNFDVIRTTQGQAARELYEKFFNVPSKNIPAGVSENGSQVVDLKELSFYSGAFKIRVARVIHSEFSLDDITSSEPLYYAQIALSRADIKEQEAQKKIVPQFHHSVVRMDDSEILVTLPIIGRENDRTIVDDNGVVVSKLLPTKGPGGECSGGVCTAGRHFVKWSNDRMISSFNTNTIHIPFGISEGLPSGSPRIQISIQNHQDTFWGDVKKVLNWFFNG